MIEVAASMIALIICVLLLVYLYKLDIIEKEPQSLIAKAFLFGVISWIPIAIIEFALRRLLHLLLPQDAIVYPIISCFLCIALIEEFWKRCAVKMAVWKRPEFNYHFDAIIYSVSVALGYAACENIGHVFRGGIAVALLRAVTSIPGHAVCGVIMGYYLGFVKAAETDGARAESRRCMRKALLIPVLLHGIYDWCCGIDSAAATVVWSVYVVALDIWAFYFIKKAAQNDTPLARKNDTAVSSDSEEIAHTADGEGNGL